MHAHAYLTTNRPVMAISIALYYVRYLRRRCIYRIDEIGQYMNEDTAQPTIVADRYKMDVLLDPYAIHVHGSKDYFCYD